MNCMRPVDSRHYEDWYNALGGFHALDGHILVRDKNAAIWCWEIWGVWWLRFRDSVPDAETAPQTWEIV